MHDEIHVVVDSLSAADETALKDDPRCHILRLIIRHGDLEWQDVSFPGRIIWYGRSNRQASYYFSAAYWCCN